MSIASWQLASRAKSKWRLFEDIAEACFCLRSFQLSQSSQDHTLFKNFQLLHNKELLNDTCRRINFNCTNYQIFYASPSQLHRITVIKKRSGLSESRIANEWPLDSFSCVFLIQNSDRRKKKSLPACLRERLDHAREKHAFLNRFSVYYWPPLMFCAQMLTSHSRSALRTFYSANRDTESSNVQTHRHFPTVCLKAPRNTEFEF